MPAWNAGVTIGTALASIQRQLIPDWECVVLDDGSNDNTASIVARVASRDRRVRLIRRPHRGLVAALDEGLLHCRAPVIARMDADDVMHRARLQEQLAALQSDPSLVAVGCHVRLFPRRTMTPRLRDYEAWLNGMRSADDVGRDRYVECPVAHPTLMMRRGMAELGYCDRGWPEDYDLVMRALAAGLRIGVVPERLLAWRDRADSLCRTSAVYDASRFTACKAFYLAGDFLAKVDTYVLWGYGDTGRGLRRALAEHGKTPSHIVEVKPSRIHQRIHGAPVIPISELPALKGNPVVVSVARAEPRRQIRAALATFGFVEGADFVCAA